MSIFSAFNGQAGGGGFVANGVEFDGSTTRLIKTTDLTGNADSKLMTVSFWFRTDSNAIDRSLFALDDNTGASSMKIDYQGNVDDGIHFLFKNSSNSTILFGESTTTITNTDWHHLLFSVDMSDTGKRHMFIDDVDATPSFTTYTDDTIDFTRATHRIAHAFGESDWNGDMAEIWIDYGSFLDFSTTSNRRKYITASGKPVNLGANGSAPGVTPILFFSGPTVDWHTNKGTGGGFTEDGTLTTSTNLPVEL